MSFFQLFQFCLGSGLGTIADFSSKQLPHDPKKGTLLGGASLCWPLQRVPPLPPTPRMITQLCFMTQLYKYAKVFFMQAVPHHIKQYVSQKIFSHFLITNGLILWNNYKFCISAPFFLASSFIIWKQLKRERKKVSNTVEYLWFSFILSLNFIPFCTNSGMVMLGQI